MLRATSVAALALVLGAGAAQAQQDISGEITIWSWDIAAQALEQGESTLAAYRRVVTPTLTGPALVNKRG